MNIFRSTEIFPNDFERKEQLEGDAGIMLTSLDGLVFDYIKEFAQIDESKISLPPYNVDLKKSNKFLAEESIEMIRSIRYLHGLGSEEISKLASELTEKCLFSQVQALIYCVKEKAGYRIIHTYLQCCIISWRATI
jgi:hypothetical protein